MNHMKKVLFLSANLCSGGAERQMVTVARLMKAQGYEVQVYCYGEGDFYAQYLKDDDIPVIFEIELKYIKRIFRVRRFIRKGQFDAVVSFLPTCNFLNDIAAIGGRTWKVITGERSSRDSTFLSLRGKLFCWFQKMTDYIVCNSYNAKDKWNQYRPQYKDKMKVIYNHVALPQVTSTYEIKKGGCLHIIVAASYQYLKNPVGLIEALLLMTEEERSRFVVDWYGSIEITTGNTKPYDEVVRLIKENHLERSFILHPQTSDIANRMKESDVVMLLSKFEGLPNVICEGMTVGKPIIMTRVSDYDRLVDEKNGFLCDANDSNSIKVAILYMTQLSDDNLVQMGVASQKKASDLFSSETITMQWKELID